MGSFGRRQGWAWSWLVVVAAGCFSGDDGSGDGGDSGAGLDTGAASGSFVPHVACNSAADCEPAERCVAVGDDGPLGCVPGLQEPFECMTGPADTQCQVGDDGRTECRPDCI